MADIYNPLAHAQAFQKRIGDLIANMRGKAGAPPAGGRLVEKPDGTVTDREGNVLYTPPAPPKGA